MNSVVPCAREYGVFFLIYIGSFSCQWYAVGRRKLNSRITWLPRPPHPIEPHSKPWQSASIAVKLKQAVVVNSSEKLQKAAFITLPVPQFFLAKEAGALPFI